MLSADLLATDKPPFYQFTSHTTRPVSMVTETSLPLSHGVGMERAGWAVTWRLSVSMRNGRGIPLPIPQGKRYYASLREMLRVPARQLAPLHRLVVVGVAS